MWSNLVPDVQKSIFEQLSRAEQLRFLQTSRGNNQLPFKYCCSPLSLKEIANWMLKEAEFLRNNYQRNQERIVIHTFPIIHGDNTQSDINIDIFNTGEIVAHGYSLGLQRSGKITQAQQIIDMLENARFSISSNGLSFIYLLRSVLSDRIGCQRQNPQMADSCFLQLLPTYFDDDYSMSFVTFWVDVVSILAEMLYSPEEMIQSFQTDVYKMVGGYGGNRVNPDQVLNWFTSRLQKLTPKDFKPLNDNIIPTLKPVKAFEFTLPEFKWSD